MSSVIAIFFVADGGTTYAPSNANLPDAYLIPDLDVQVEATLLKGRVTPGGGSAAITINTISK
jgi:hypothetical protein